MFSRRIVFHGGVAGVAATLASCGFSDADAPERGNDYVAAPPQPRTFTPPDELDLRGESHVALPLALPVATALGANLVWFGVVTTIAIEIGLLTPPFGLSVYVIKASMNDPTMTLATIFRGAFPFVLITLAVTLLLMAFPQISLALL